MTRERISSFCDDVKEKTATEKTADAGGGSVPGRQRRSSEAQDLRGSLSVFKGGDDYEVVIDFDRWAADLIRGRRWHSSQELTELPGGQARLRLRLNAIEEAERWVLSWGSHATVVRPQALRERLVEVGQEYLRQYEES
jgi:predicted DNA-binding transcriptional regulator YafY